MFTILWIIPLVSLFIWTCKLQKDFRILRINYSKILDIVNDDDRLKMLTESKKASTELQTIPFDFPLTLDEIDFLQNHCKKHLKKSTGYAKFLKGYDFPDFTILKMETEKHVYITFKCDKGNYHLLLDNGEKEFVYNVINKDVKYYILFDSIETIKLLNKFRNKN